MRWENKKSKNRISNMFQHLEEISVDPEHFHQPRKILHRHAYNRLQIHGIHGDIERLKRELLIGIKEETNSIFRRAEGHLYIDIGPRFCRFSSFHNKYSDNGKNTPNRSNSRTLQAIIS